MSPRALAMGAFVTVVAIACVGRHDTKPQSPTGVDSGGPVSAQDIQPLPPGVTPLPPIVVPAPPNVVPGGGPGPTPAPSGTPGPSPSPSSTPGPSPSPSPDLLVVSNVTTTTGKTYPLVRTDDPGAPNNAGADWIDWPYVLQRNFGVDPSNPLYFIRTAVADTASPNSTIVSFNVNRCAKVMVIFGEKGGPGDAGFDPYPSWLQSGGWACSVTGGAGSVEVFYNVTSGSADQVSGPSCNKTVSAGPVDLGPREPTGTNSKMYTVFILGATGCP